MIKRVPNKLSHSASSTTWKLAKTISLIGISTAFIILGVNVYISGVLKTNFEQSGESRPFNELLFEEYRKCLLNGMRSQNAWTVWFDSVKLWEICQRKTDILSRLPLIPLKNNDETKYVLKAPPILKANDECNIVTLGVGNDTKSEVALSKVIPTSCRFYGADPVVDMNKELYSRIGTFFPYAIAATNGSRMASLLDMATGKYKPVTISHIDLITFLRYHLKVNIVDYLLMDTESSEFDMLPFFLPGGLLDQNNITVCQWTCEFHDLEDTLSKQQYADFLWKNTLFGRYLPLNFINVGHIRVTLINDRDETCVQRYLQ